MLLLNSCGCLLSIVLWGFVYPTSNSYLFLFLFLFQLCNVFSTHRMLLSVLLLFIELTVYFLNLVCVLVSQLAWSVDFVLCPLVSQNSSVFALCVSACTIPYYDIPGPDWDLSTSEAKWKVEALFILCPNMAFCLPMSTCMLAVFLIYIIHSWNDICLFSWRYNPLWSYFHSPVAGFSLLVFEVSWSHTTTRHSR